MGNLNWGWKACGAFLLWATAAVALPAQTFNTIYSFDKTDGANPYAPLVQSTNGKLYGTTYAGDYNGCGAVCGTVFEITTGGTLTTLYNFCSDIIQGGCADGEYPMSGLVLSTNGKLYGTTYEGGYSNGETTEGGTLFDITSAGALATTYSFCPSQENPCPDGNYPAGGLIQGANGKYYGTTVSGGTNNDGTIFEVTAGGALTTLHSFAGGPTDGKFPYAGLVQATNGKLYGTTAAGGAYGDGTVFEITTGGALTTLHSFSYSDGDYPAAALVQAANGDLYGTTQYGGTGGANGNCVAACGTVFQITTSGDLTTLYNFGSDCSGGVCPDGIYPAGALILGTDGNLYGTTEGGGTFNGGTVFKITTGGALTTLHSFSGTGTDGYFPRAALFQATNGTFYGTTDAGGASNACSGGCGTVFSLGVGLGPFVETVPTSGAVGKAVTILGTNLTGATSVTFNGTAATFTVKSKSEITTTVPTGATTGTVQVVTPGGTLKSNVPFTVTP
jgi:uncharacterized repeat protein (TIGR03803 family)